MRRAWTFSAAVTSTALLATLLGTAPAGAAPSPAPSAPASSAELEAEAARQAAALAATELARSVADAAAAAALEGYQQAQRRSEQAARDAKAQAAAAKAAEVATAEAERALSRYIGSMYRNGVGDSRLSALTSLVDAPDPNRLFGGIGLAQRVGERQDDAVQGLATAEAEQRAAAERARLAGEAAVAASKEAEAAKRVADAAVTEAARRVVQARGALALTKDAVDGARAREARLATAEGIARERSGIPSEAIDGAFANRPAGECQGASTSGYPNGQIPLSALCPLWGPAGQLLRADAAASFTAMSRAYAEVFSAPVCVTDSYRDLPSQIAVAAAKPALAAVPGTSNHGWGVAVDLCDGVQRFGSPQHEWMRANAMAFGWFHPNWAQQGGSKPEPWHWEFAG